MISKAYKRGYWAHARLDDTDANPYSIETQSTSFHAWLAGWNDRDMGYELDLMQFSKPTESVEKLVKQGKSHAEIQEKTGCAPSTISRVAKRIGLSRDNRQLKTTEINLLMSDKPIWLIGFELGMSREQVSQHRYKQKQRDLKSNLQNLKFGE